MIRTTLASMFAPMYGFRLAIAVDTALFVVGCWAFRKSRLSLIAVALGKEPTTEFPTKMGVFTIPRALFTIMILDDGTMAATALAMVAFFAVI